MERVPYRGSVDRDCAEPDRSASCWLDAEAAVCGEAPDVVDRELEGAQTGIRKWNTASERGRLSLVDAAEVHRSDITERGAEERPHDEGVALG